MNAITLRTCDRCHWPYDLDAFYNSAGPNAGALALGRRTVCAGCEQTEADRRKIERRPLVKAQNAISWHARRAGIDRAAFARRYGWDVQRMAYDIEHGHANTCCYCWQPYREMDGGLSVVTLDIVDPEAEPYYRTNTRWCCHTCNTQKQRMTPELWARRCAAWADWRSNRGRIPDQARLFALPEAVAVE